MRWCLIWLVSFAIVFLSACNLSGNVEEPATLTAPPITITVVRNVVTRTPVGVPTAVVLAPTQISGVQPTAFPFLIDGTDVNNTSSTTIDPLGVRPATLQPQPQQPSVPSGQVCDPGVVPSGGGDDNRLPNTGPWATLYVVRDVSCQYSLQIWLLNDQNQGYNALTVTPALFNLQGVSQIAATNDGNLRVFRTPSGGVDVVVRINDSQQHRIQLDAMPPGAVSSNTEPIS